MKNSLSGNLLRGAVFKNMVEIELMFLNRGTKPSDYIEISAKGNLGKEGELMSDFEMLSIVLMILGIVVTILIAYIDHMKK